MQDHVKVHDLAYSDHYGSRERIGEHWWINATVLAERVEYYHNGPHSIDQH